MELRFPLILDGATGTELQKRGYTGDVCAEQWTLDHLRNSFAFSIPQCHAYSRIRNTAGTINFRIVLLPHFITTHKTYFLYIFPFIA